MMYKIIHDYPPIESLLLPPIEIRDFYLGLIQLNNLLL